jgi:hypothetical protein
MGIGSIEAWSSRERCFQPHSEITMSKVETAETHGDSQEQLPLQQAIVSSQDEASSDPTGNRMLYVLGFGVLGAIFTNTLVFIYFVSFYASG